MKVKQESNGDQHNQTQQHHWSVVIYF